MSPMSFKRNVAISGCNDCIVRFSGDGYGNQLCVVFLFGVSDGCSATK